MAETGERRGVGRAGASAAEILRGRLANRPAPRRQMSRPASSREHNPPQSEIPNPPANDKSFGARVQISQENAIPALPPAQAKTRDKPNKPNKINLSLTAGRPEKSARPTDFKAHAIKPKVHPVTWVTTVLINILILALPLGVLHVYDQVMPNHSSETLAFLIFGLAGVILVDTVMKIARGYLLDRAAMQHHYALKCNAVKRVVHATSGEINKIAPGKMLEKLNALDELRDSQRSDLQLMWLDLPFVALFLAVIWLIAGHLVWLALALCLVSGGIFIVSSKALMTRYQHRLQCENQRNNFVIDVLENIATIKSMAMEPLIQRRFETIYAGSAEANYQTMKLNNLSQTLGTLFAYVSMICMVSAGAIMVIGGNLTLGGLGCCALLSGACLQPILRALQSWTEIQTSNIAAGQLSELFRLPGVDEKPLARVSGVQGGILLRHLSFDDHQTAQPVLKDVNLEIPAGSTIGFKSRNGGSRPPLLKLISGELGPTEGSILIDGLPLSGDKGSALAQQIAYVQPRSEIFQGTVLENITTFARGDAIDHAHAAAKLIGLEADIHNLPQGYDTQLSKAIAEQLPAGLIQRIIIARAIALRPRILLLDEADNILDAESRYLLQLGLKQIKGEMTILIVSSQSSLLQSADKVYELVEGRLVPVDMFTALGYAPVRPYKNSVPTDRPLTMKG